MNTYIRQNVQRWPKVFTVLVILTILDIATDFGALKFVGRQTTHDAVLLTIGALIVVGAAAGIIYSVLAPVHAFKAATLLDKVEGRQDTAVTDETDETFEEDSFEDNPEEEEEEEYDEESDQDSTL